VSDNHHGHAFKRKRRHNLEHFVDHFGIKRGGRLVEQYDLRVERQRASDRNALLLSAREVCWLRHLLMSELDPAEEISGPVLCLLHGTPEHDTLRETYVVNDVKMGI
jgi:hypothetical protein